MRKFLKIAIIVFFAFFVSLINSHAQQIPLMNNFYRNPYLFNPAYCRNDSIADAMAIYRNQWVGIQGAPETHMLALNGLVLGKGWNLGGLAYNDASNITKRLGAFISSSYLVKLGADHNLRFGLSLGFLNNRIDFGSIKAKDPNESTLIAVAQSRTVFDGNAGLFYTHQKVEIGFSTLHLFNSQLNYSDPAFNSKARVQLLRHYFVFLKYNTLFESEKFSFSPLGMLHSAQSLPLGWNIGGILEYNNLLFFSPMYKSKYGIVLNMGVFLTRAINVSYAYEIPTNGIGTRVGATHEFALQVTFKNGDRRKPMPSSLAALDKMPIGPNDVNDKKTKKEKKSDDESLNALKWEIDSLHNRINEITAYNQSSKIAVDTLQKINKGFSTDIEKLQSELELTQTKLFEMEGTIQGYLKDKNIYFENEQIHPDSLTEFNTKIFNYYVIAGSFFDLRAAQFLAKRMKVDYKLESKIMSSYGINYVVTKSVQNNAEAADEIKELNQRIDKKYMPQGARLYITKKN